MADKKRVLVLQHIQENPAGRVGTLLDEYEIFYHLIHVGRDHLPDPTRYNAIVVLDSSLFGRPAWQMANGVTNGYSNGCRQLPDVSAVADQLAVYFQGQWGAVAGTSASAPI
jgi:hypothetical protein